MTGMSFVSKNAHAQTGTLYGTTERYKNSSGGYTTRCPTSSQICTENRLNSDGTHTITIHLYDSRATPIGTITMHTMSGDEAFTEHPEEGYINDIETTDGILYGATD